MKEGVGVLLGNYQHSHDVRYQEEANGLTKLPAGPLSDVMQCDVM